MPVEAPVSDPFQSKRLQDWVYVLANPCGLATNSACRKSASYQLDATLPEEALGILIQHGLASRTEEASAQLKQSRAEGIQMAEADKATALRAAEIERRANISSLEQIIRADLAEDVVKRFRCAVNISCSILC